MFLIAASGINSSHPQSANQLSLTGKHHHAPRTYPAHVPTSEPTPPNRHPPTRSPRLAPPAWRPPSATQPATAEETPVGHANHPAEISRHQISSPHRNFSHQRQPLLHALPFKKASSFFPLPPTFYIQYIHFINNQFHPLLFSPTCPF